MYCVFSFTVTGCADLIAPEHAWHKRTGNVATVGCEHQNKTWHLTCVHNSYWDGVVGSCDESDGMVEDGDHNFARKKTKLGDTSSEIF